MGPDVRRQRTLSLYCFPESSPFHHFPLTILPYLLRASAHYICINALSTQKKIIFRATKRFYLLFHVFSAISVKDYSKCWVKLCFPLVITSYLISRNSVTVHFVPCEFSQLNYSSRKSDCDSEFQSFFGIKLSRFNGHRGEDYAGGHHRLRAVCQKKSCLGSVRYNSRFIRGCQFYRRPRIRLSKDYGRTWESLWHHHFCTLRCPAASGYGSWQWPLSYVTLTGQPFCIE